MNKTKYSLPLVYMPVSFLKNSVKIKNVQKILWVVHRTDNHKLFLFFFFCFPEYLVGHLIVMGTQGRFSLCGPVLNIAEHRAYLEPFTSYSPQNSRKSPLGAVSSLLRTAMEKPFTGLFIFLPHTWHTVWALLLGSFLWWIEGSVSPGMTGLIYHCIPHAWGHAKHSEDFQKLFIEWTKGQRQHLRFHLLSYLGKSIKRVGGETWLVPSARVLVCLDESLFVSVFSASGPVWHLSWT